MSTTQALLRKSASTPKAVIKRVVHVPAGRLYSTAFDLLIIDCPFCPREHQHGSGGLAPDENGSYGTRSPHCCDPYRVPVAELYPDGYELVTA